MTEIFFGIRSVPAEAFKQLTDCVHDMGSLSTEQMIEGYFLATTKSVGTLFREELFAHTLIIIYSAIDTYGLLNAPPSQTSASGASFKAWVKKYLLARPGIEFTDVDMWAARCRPESR